MASTIDDRAHLLKIVDARKIDGAPVPSYILPWSPQMYCPMCGTQCQSNAQFCMKCGARLTLSTEQVSALDNAVWHGDIPWHRAGKIAVIRCPVSKNKEKYEGDWIYKSGTMSRRVLFKKEVIDLRQQLVKVEVAAEFIATLAGYKKAGEITPGYFMVLTSTPVLAEAYQERRRRTLSRMVLAEIHLKTDWFYAYTNEEIYVELMQHTPPSAGESR